jgi:hypothetical protein
MTIRVPLTPWRVVASCFLLACVAPLRAQIEFSEAEQIPDPAYALVAKSRVIWLGEMHGTQEAPRLLLGLIRLVARHDRPPVVGLELPDTSQPAIDEFLRTGNTEALATRSIFQWPIKDGRSSRAMFELLAALSTEKVAAVVCFDTSKAKNAQERDTEMAANLEAAAKRFPTAKLVVLSGGIHSRFTVGTSWDATYRPAACELAKTLPAILPLELRYERGTMWAILGKDHVGGVHTLLGWPKPGTAPFSISVGATPVEGHLGELFSRTLTASPPWEPEKN